MPPFLVVNPSAADGGRDLEALLAAAASRGVETRVVSAPEELRDAAEEAAAEGATAVGVAGGDGSLATVAAVTLERDLPFVCIPFGTRNHFARDAGLDRDDPVGALDAFAGSERRVDAARVNGRLFLNNVSLGAYAELVHRRERRRRRREVLAGARALWRLARDPRPLRLRFDGKPVVARIVLFANNAYEMDLFDVGARARLDEGLLYAYVAHGWLPRDWDERSGGRFRVDLAAADVQAAVDGEPVELRSPLELELLPRALRLLLPRREDG